MKKVVMLEQSDYNELLSVLKDAESSVKNMRKSFTKDHLSYLLTKAIDILQAEDSSTDDLNMRLDRLENRIFFEQTQNPYL